MPNDDAIIQEVRAIRHQIAQECDNDLEKFLNAPTNPTPNFLPIHVPRDDLR